MQDYKPNPQGIDYAGFSTVNRDSETGIRYGVISTHALHEWFWDETESDYGDAHCPKCGRAAAEASEVDREVDREDYAQYRARGCDDYACDACKLLLSSDDCFGDEPQGWSIDNGEYKVIDCLDSDAMVIKSPYYTYAHFCSPCVPGACNMESLVDPEDIDASTAKCYAFGHDWYDGGRAPYPVYSVDTGELVEPEVQSC